MDVDEGGESLDWPLVLGVVEEVSMAGLELRIPVEDIELWIAWPRFLTGGTAIVCKWGRLKALLRGTSLGVERHPSIVAVIHCVSNPDVPRRCSTRSSFGGGAHLYLYQVEKYVSSPRRYVELKLIFSEYYTRPKLSILVGSLFDAMTMRVDDSRGLMND